MCKLLSEQNENETTVSHLPGTAQVLTNSHIVGSVCQFINIIIQISVPIHSHNASSAFLYPLSSFWFLHAYGAQTVEWPPWCSSDGVLSLQYPPPLIVNGTCDLSLIPYGKGDGMSHLFHDYVKTVSYSTLSLFQSLLPWQVQSSIREALMAKNCEYCLENVSRLLGAEDSQYRLKLALSYSQQRARVLGPTTTRKWTCQLIWTWIFPWAEDPSNLSPELQTHRNCEIRMCIVLPLTVEFVLICHVATENVYSVY